MAELSRQSGELDINIEHGVDYGFSAIYKIDGAVEPITGYTALFVIKGNPGSSNNLLQITDTTGIIIDGANGKVTVNITDTQSSFGSREMYYSLKITSPAGNDIQLLRGKCKSHSTGE